MRTSLTNSPLRLRRFLSAGAIAAVASAAALLALAPGASAAGAAAGTRAAHPIDAPALYKSRLLWATIDVCNATDQPDTLGVRGSMPGDGQAHDTMYMRFRLQYMNTTTKAWTDLANGVSPHYASVGTGASARQGGRSFQLSPVAGQPAVTMRGVVSFQWRHGSTVLAQISRPTTPERHALAGSDPEGFSAASCLIG
ncbi:MAG TPA: hypothetical protein VH081_12420 [Solirubrobacteraceae bacterium]|jgi:hypothetical protein|nr:hypothetical protein [Solirubrobacteraceae bacterium]